MPKLLQDDFSTAVIWFIWRVMPLIATVALIGAIAIESGFAHPKFSPSLAAPILLPFLIPISFSRELERLGVWQFKVRFSGRCGGWVCGFGLISIATGFLMTNRIGTFFLIQEFSFTVLCMTFGRQLVESTGKEVKDQILNPFLRVLYGVGTKLLFAALELLVFRIILSAELFIGQSAWVDGIMVVGLLSLRSLHLAVMAVILRRSFYISSDWDKSLEIV